MVLFEENFLNIFLNSFILLMAIIFLWQGASFLIESASNLAKKWGISELVIGLTVIALGTSAPEFAVTINAALNQKPDISVGNIVGSNIFNLGFILGFIALIKPITTSKKLVYRDGLFMIGVTFLLLIFFSDYYLSFWEGALLLGLLICYLIFLYLKKEPLDLVETNNIALKRSSWKDYLILIFSLAAVVLGGHYLVESASFLAKTGGISDWVIGVTIVAAGTSAPELVTSLTAVLKGKPGMSAGNLIGSDLFNILGVLGLAGCLNPMQIDSKAYPSLLMLFFMVGLVIFFFRTNWQVSRKEGAILVMISILRWVSIYFIK